MCVFVGERVSACVCGSSFSMAITCASVSKCSECKRQLVQATSSASERVRNEGRAGERGRGVESERERKRVENGRDIER